MMQKCNKYGGWVVFTLMIGAVLAVIPFQQAVTFEARKSGELLAYFLLRDTDKTFQIEYTHSIHQSEVIETYQVENSGVIRQIELEYEDTSIGMPSESEGGGDFEMKDGKYYIRDMKRDFSWIDISVGQVNANHRLLIQNKTIPLSSFSAPGSVVRVKKQKLALWQLWKGVNLLGRSTKV
ncbi:DUF1850 domain-containing protein [Siminovitchia thermophila]|nr:DUF1850 domain-containing protein [Siminovitchia thermophila]